MILANLSKRMGEGLRLEPYYLWYYLATIITLLTIPIHIYIHETYKISPPDSSLVMQAVYYIMLIISNIIVIIVSVKYWWWLKKEIYTKK